ncbi:MarR family transcriptional regulator, partial [Pseudomonas aeruginosa]
MLDRNYDAAPGSVNMPDLKNHAVQQQAMMEAFFFAYQAFTTNPAE